MQNDTYGRYRVTYRVKTGEQQEEHGPCIILLNCDGSRASVELLTLETAQLLYELPVAVMIETIEPAN